MCSFLNDNGKRVGRTTAKGLFEGKKGVPLPLIQNTWQEGDVLFFDTGRNVNPGHTAIYMGNNKMLHASSGKGAVVIVDLGPQWMRKLVGAKRF